MSEPDETRHRLTLRSRDDLLAAVPYLLGFPPVESLVVVADRDFTAVVLTARADLPAAATAADEIGSLPALASAMPPTVSGVTLIGYGPPGRVTPTLDAAIAVFTGHGLTVHDAMRVTDGRYFSYLCRDLDCCPADGTPLTDPAGSTVAAQATYAGLVVLPDRAALTAQLAPVDGADRTAMTRATERAFQWLAQALPDPVTEHDTNSNSNSDTDTDTDAGAVARSADRILRSGKDAIGYALRTYEQGGRLTDDDAARLTLLLHLPPVLDHAVLDTPSNDAALQLWTDLTRRAEPDLMPTAAAALAVTAWRRGNGPLARAAAEHALDTDPQHRHARLIIDALDRGIPPTDLGPRAAAPDHR